MLAAHRRRVVSCAARSWCVGVRASRRRRPRCSPVAAGPVASALEQAGADEPMPRVESPIDRRPRRADHHGRADHHVDRGRPPPRRRPTATGHHDHDRGAGHDRHGRATVDRRRRRRRPPPPPVPPAARRPSGARRRTPRSWPASASASRTTTTRPCRPAGIYRGAYQFNQPAWDIDRPPRRPRRPRRPPAPTPWLAGRPGRPGPRPVPLAGRRALGRRLHLIA